ncbi:hypothetical protein [Sporomusa acidovorans]|uniref:Calcineurin-like phosphoesterase domain-containing protein n=1 Tax=Sporomusa acidovorans (strain ATCC 49682 / DSM 3132 / Mol) TaxID=1123286 RepID=A0ABZ3J173_SPOA4|nr:hypothetical protein [Sporomusa acidovorans]OZC13646.1 hypothetical protein SPACI_56270 [Sporomusa acidovorans DSM 3132]SDE86166.1 hypothetical protein SAMN04488499_102425 [Sporomusa acidovorans]
MMKVSHVKLAVPFSSQTWLTMLVMQPLVDGMLFRSAAGYQWKPEAKAVQLQHLSRLMEISQGPKESRILSRTTDIILIPEYSIPGLEGFELLHRSISSSPINNQLLIGGMDGLSRADFSTLLSKSSLPPNAVSQITADVSGCDWVNTAIILEKAGPQINYYLQPKHLLAFEEESTSMCQTKQVLFFVTSPPKTSNPICIIVPICFDWIGKEGCSTQVDGLWEEFLDIQKREGIVYPQWLIPVIQHNPKPNHLDFLGKASNRLTSGEWQRVYGDKACIIMVNTASPAGSNTHGHSAVIYCNGQYGRCTPRPVVSSKPRQGLIGCGEQRFREDGPVIHGVLFVPPNGTTGTPGDARVPFKEAKLMSLDPAMTAKCCRRWPGAFEAVGPYVKVYGDLLDRQERRLKSFGSGEALKADYDVYLTRAIESNRAYPDEAIRSKMKLLCLWDGHSEDCDEWREDYEGPAIHSLITGQSLVSLAWDDVNLQEPLHGSFFTDELHNVFIVAEGHQYKSHKELADDIIEAIHAGKIKTGRTGQVLIIGHTHNADVPYRGPLSGLPEAGDITEPARIKYIPLGDLVRAFSVSENKNSFKSKLMELLEGA